MSNNNNGYFGVFVAGVALGAIAGLLFAPRSGKETREYIGRKAEEGSDFVTAKGKELRRQAEEIVDKGRKTAERLADRSKAFAERVARA